MTVIRHGHLRRTTVPDNDSGQLLRTTTLDNYFGILPTRLLPCAGYVHIYVCRIRAGLPYIQRRGLLPMLVSGLRSQATQSLLVHTLTPIPSGIRNTILIYSTYKCHNHNSGNSQYNTITTRITLGNLLARAPETKLTNYLVARPCATLGAANTSRDHPGN